MNKQKIGTKVLLPWIVLVIMVVILISIRFIQNRNLNEMREQNEIHKKAQIISERLRYQLEIRWSQALLYSIYQTPESLKVINTSEKETIFRIKEMEILIGSTIRSLDPIRDRKSELLFNNHLQVYSTYTKIYNDFLKSIEQQDQIKQEQLLSLLKNNYSILRASIDDLFRFHQITENSILENFNLKRKNYDLQLFGLLGLLVIGGFIFSRYQTKSIIKPIEGLTDAILQIEQGKEMELHFYDSDDDEIVSLSNAFLSMIKTIKGKNANIQEAYDEVEKHRNNLEELVEERTNQLKLALDESYKASKVKEQFLANMSHEIRTPLNAMMVLLHLLKKTKLTDNQTEKIRKIHISSIHLLNLIDNLLDYTKIESENLILESLPIDIPAIFLQIKSIMDTKAEEKSLILEVEIPEIPVNVLGDSTRITQAILNLVNNAIKFSEKGKIVVRSEIIDISKEYLHINFKVEDQGPGIPENEIKRLFTPFVQLDSTTTRSFGGSGLGLTITKELSNLMNGDCYVTSILGKGSTFWFSALLKIENLSENEAIKQSVEYLIDEDVYQKEFSGMTLLLVDDDNINLEVASELLRNIGFIVENASNGLEALEYIQNENNCSLILMDMHMPKMDGLEATKEIRKLKNGKSIPIIALTGNAFLNDRIHCFDAGMNDIIIKPIDAEELFKTMYKWIEIIPKVEEQEHNNLSDFKGIDNVYVHKIFGKKIDRYFNLLYAFNDSYNEASHLCRQHMDSNDFMSAKSVIHKMSGAAGTLGLIDIHSATRQIESLLLKETVDKEQFFSILEQLEDAYKLFLEFISLRSNNEEKQNPGNEGSAEIKELLNEMENLLTICDIECINLFEINKDEFTKISPDHAKLLNKHINNYDYNEALDIIKSMRSI